MSKTILEIKHVTKTYPGVVALDDVSLSFREGEIHALVGENGAGKSTIIKVISGAIMPDSGSVLLDQKEMVGAKDTIGGDSPIQVVYQEFNLCPHLAVYENIFLGRPIRKGPYGTLVDKPAMIEKTRQIFDQLGISIDPEAKVNQLSVAYMQFVEIAKAISRDCRVLIMDEPTAVLTTAEVEILLNRLKELKEQGVTILYVSHRMEEIFQITDRCSVLRDGQYITTVDTDKTSRPELIQYMVGRDMSETFPERHTTIGEEVLRVEGLSGNTVTDVNFTLHKGEILGFGGLVGAGRTETVEMIFGAARVEEGAIYLNGEKTSIQTPRAAVNKRIALIPEDRKRDGLILNKSIRENVTLPMLKELTNGIVINRKKQHDIVEKQIADLAIKTPSEEQTAGNLSGGNQQKVVLAKWLATGSDILIFDEPTRGIDVGAKREIYKLMNELVEQGKAIIMISSEMPELLGMSDRLVIFSERKQVGELAHDEMDQARVLDMASGDK